MLLWSQPQKTALAAALIGAALLFAWFLREPPFLMVAVLAATLASGWRIGLALALCIAALLGVAHFTLNLQNAAQIAGACMATWIVAAAMDWISQQQTAWRRSEPEGSTKGDEADLREVVDAIPALIWTSSIPGEVNHVNKALIDWVGIPHKQLDGLIYDLPNAVENFIHPQDSEAVSAAFEQAFRTERGFELKYRQKFRDGEYHWVAGGLGAKRNRQGEIEGWFGVNLDIDVEMRAFEQLRQSELELRRILDTVPAQIWLLGPNGILSYINRQCADWLGLDHTAVFELEASERQRLFEDLYHPDDLHQAMATFMGAFATLEPLHLKFRLRRWDGEYRWLDSRVAPLRDETGEVVRWYGISFDIEEEVNAVQALQQSEQHLQRVIDTVPVLMFRMTAEGEPVYANKRLRNHHGLDLDDFNSVGNDRRGSMLRRLVHPDDTAEVEQALQHSFANGEPFRRRYRQLRGDGTYGWIEGRIEPLRDSDGHVIEWYGVNLDVDEEIQAQENLRLAQEKLARAAQGASLAELSASIANEVNQPLAAIVADAKACERWLSHEVPNVDKAREAAAEMIKDAETASDIVNRIRSLFKSSAGTMAPTDVNEIVLEVGRLMKNEIKQFNSQVVMDLAPSMRPMSIDRVQIQQVLVNLMRNGLEAMEAIPREQRLLTVRTVQLAGQVQIEVVDAGRGIGDTRRIFEPLFTTKDQGIGMGLAISKSIVERHGGQLSVDSVPGRTAFILVLPA